jgi:alditol oxidase
MGSLRNWAGNVQFRAAAVHRPASVGEVQRLVAGSGRIRALGTAHSFSLIADTPGDLVSVADLPAAVDVDTASRRARVSAGLRYGEFAPRLDAAGLALANLASLPHISVGGAVATGTHGSGDQNASLAAAVSELEIVTAPGDVLTVSRDSDPDRFAGLVVALGAYGIVTSLTLDLVPAFTAAQWVYTGMPFDTVADRFSEITSAAYSVSMFTDWREQVMTQTWLKTAGQPGEPPVAWLGGRLAARQVNPVAGMPAENATPQLGQAGPWHERLPHFRPAFTPSAGEELQSEFLLGREHAAAALRELARLSPLLAPVVQVSEIRTVDADDLWLSPCYDRASVAFHFTWVPDAAAVAPVLAAVEAALMPLHPRPHWGKLSSMPPEVIAAGYPRIEDARRLAAGLDPGGKFRNEFTDPYLRPDR